MKTKLMLIVVAISLTALAGYTATGFGSGASKTYETAFENLLETW